MHNHHGMRFSPFFFSGRQGDIFYGYHYGRNIIPKWAIVAGIGLAAVSGLLLALVRRKRKKNYPKNVIILHVFPRIQKAPNISPFAIKLETFVRMAKLPYQIEYTYEMSPKHKIPWITYNEEVVSDSQFIIEYLNKKFNVDLNSHLTDVEQSIARAMQKMAEENLYWGLVCLWANGGSCTRKIIPMSRSQFWLLKRQVQHTTYNQGMGRHSLSEVNKIVLDDLKALSDFIGTKKYLMGDKICETDCAIFGMLSFAKQMPENSILQQVIDDDMFPNLTAYFKRIKSMYWSDWFDLSVKFPTFGLQPRNTNFVS